MTQQPSSGHSGESDLGTVSVARLVAVPPERAFRALTDADEVAAWLWPTRFGTQAQTDPRPGGSYRFAASGPDAPPLAASGSYLTVDSPHRLAFDWAWDGEPQRTLVMVTVAAATVAGAAGSSVSLREEGFTSAEAQANHQIGWEHCLDRLAEHLIPQRS